MKKHGLALLSLGLLFVGAGAYAQTINLKADVPFNFIVTGTKLPSGQYWVQTLPTSGALAIRALANDRAKIVLAGRCESLKKSDRGKLVFHRYGDRYFLAQIWMPGSTSGRELPKARQEIEVAMDYPEQNVVLLASLQ